MDDVIQVEIGKDQGYAIAPIDLKMVGEGLIQLLEKMSDGFIQQSISKASRSNSVSRATPRYCTTCGYHISLRNSYSFSNCCMVTWL